MRDTFYYPQATSSTLLSLLNEVSQQEVTKVESELHMLQSQVPVEQRWV